MRMRSARRSRLRVEDIHAWSRSALSARKREPKMSVVRREHAERSVCRRWLVLDSGPCVGRVRTRRAVAGSRSPAAEHCREALRARSRGAGADPRAIAVQLWRPLGMTSMREYLESMGYGPQVAAERLRVAEALEAMPAIEEALAAGELSYSAVRELTRIATRKTERAWVDRVPRQEPAPESRSCVGRARAGRCARVEAQAAGAPASVPRGPAAGDVDALLRQARQAIEAERGERLDNDELLEALCGLASRGAQPEWQGAAAASPGLVTVCSACKQGWQTVRGGDPDLRGRGRGRALRCAARRRAGPRDPRDSRADPAVRVAARSRPLHDSGLPRGELHRRPPHRAARAGRLARRREPRLLCAGHHRALHDGLIVIRGPAPGFEVIRVAEVPRVGESEGSGSDSEGSMSDSEGSMSDSERSVPHVAEFEETAPPVPHVGDCRGGGGRSSSGDVE